MRTQLSIGLCGLAYFLLSASPAMAQFDRNYLANRNFYNSRPAFSPYLNLLRPGSSTAVNYYGLVRPQQDFRAAANTLQSEIQGVDTAINRLSYQDYGIRETGHAAGFMTQGPNFMSLQGGGSSAGQRSGSNRSSQIQSNRPSSSRGGSSSGQR
ncbi:MAG: hypothetical protein HY040_24755 [Planctomycetes bacterium]|nr:hypothetical protein [Planctomycetota bacterium]